MWTVLLAGIICVNGWQLGRTRLFNSLPLDRGERGMLWVLLAAAIWIGANWFLAIPHLLTWQGLAGIGLIGFGFSIPGCLALLKSMREWPGLKVSKPRIDTWFLIPVALWALYTLWRGTFLPPNNHDALAYHFPKAVMVMKAHAVACFPSQDFRISYFPWNYELLLSDFLILDGSDRFTLWLSTGLFVALIHASWALARRWWGEGLPALACPLAVASAPVLLMHAGAHKNDLMFAFFALQAIHWFARWWSDGDGGFLGLCGIATALAIGTKSTGFLLLGLVALGAVLQAVRNRPIERPMWNTSKALITFSVMFLSLGGWGYILNAWATRHINGPAVLPAQNGAMSIVFPEWHYSWMFPYMLLKAPFSSRVDAIWVPWRHEWWFWPKWEVYFSNFGILFSILIVLVPGLVWVLRKQYPMSKTRVTATLGAGLCALIGLVGVRPYGGFNWFPRFLLFLLPIVAGLTLPPMVEWAGRRIKGGGYVLIGMLCVYASWTMIDTAIHDSFTPLSYVMASLSSEGRPPTHFSPYRSPGIFDAMAGPKDTVAFYGDFDGWVYPLYGEGLGRTVDLIDPHSVGSQNHGIPPGTQWVVVDRSFEAIWGHPAFKTMGDFEQCLAKWHPSPGDLVLIQGLLRDPAYEPIYVFPGRGQAIFHLRPVPAHPPGPNTHAMLGVLSPMARPRLVESVRAGC